MQKIVILILADLNESHESRGRVRNALEVASECKAAGDAVRVVFDGGGTVSLAAILQPTHKMYDLYQSITSAVDGACAFCAQAFHVKENLEQAGITFLADYQEHPSIRSYLVDGYQVLTF